MDTFLTRAVLLINFYEVPTPPRRSHLSSWCSVGYLRSRSRGLRSIPSRTYVRMYLCGHCCLAVGWIGWLSVGAVGHPLGWLGVSQGELALVGPLNQPPTHTQPTSEVSTLAPSILRVLNPFLALVWPRPNPFGWF